MVITAGTINNDFDHDKIVEPVNLQAAFESKRVTPPHSN
jgi:hypothetical protein